ncbi:lycopene cyclase domain-containing protein [Halosegnis marinus]|uniref:Lycopene cyclase domain-containing protein n=1 Tax=Halosegnis marinus TaxID=3034023 RepID=A0ABD5ZPN2_9EURY|nr:lycopene cyclase domain-containing protein [Halosegnis sp. DT85]
MAALSYLGFHLVFLAPLLFVLVLGVSLRRLRLPRARVQWGGIGILVAVAVLYTIPWEMALIGRGVWTYGEGAVRARLWGIPYEELLFIAVQPIATALWLYQFTDPSDRPLAVSLPNRALGALAGLAICAVGVALYLRGGTTTYLGALLGWAGPVFAIQWAFGWPYLVEKRRTVAVGVGLPTLYLCAADTVAIGVGIWKLSPTYTTGLAFAGLPLEEALFFLCTNLFVVQGLVLWLWLTERLGIDPANVPADPVGQ